MRTLDEVRQRASTPTVVAVLALDSLVTGMFVPLSLLYLQAASRESLARIGIILTIAGVLSLPAPLWVGRLVDAHGAKRLVLIAQLVQGLGFVGYLFARNGVFIFLAAFIASVGQRIYWSSVFALATDISEHASRPRARERWFGLIASLRAVGYGVGAVIGGVAVASNAYVTGRVLVGVSTTLLAAAALFVGVLVSGRRTVSATEIIGSYRSLQRDRPYMILIAVNSLFCICNVMLSIALAPTIAKAWPSLSFLVGPLLALNTLIQAGLQIPVVRAVQRTTRVKALATAAILWCSWTLLVIGAMSLSRVWASALLVVSVLCYSFAQLIHGPLMNAISVEAAAPEARGRYLAVFQYSFAVATVVAPGLYTVLSTIQKGLPWIVVGTLVISSIPLIGMLARRMPALRAVASTSGGVSDTA